MSLQSSSLPRLWALPVHGFYSSDSFSRLNLGSGGGLSSPGSVGLGYCLTPPFSQLSDISPARFTQ